MDIQFIEEEHRDNIFKIMELCNCDMAEAYELYNNNGCNVQKAVQAKFNTFESPSSMSRGYQQSFSPPSSYGNNNNRNLSYGQNFGFSQGSQDEEYDNYKIFKESGLSFQNKYDVRRENSGITKGILSFFKSPENIFKKSLEQYIGRRSNLNLQNGSLSEALQSVSKQKFPLIVHVLDFSRQSSTAGAIKRIYLQQQLMQIMNEQFKNYGLDTKEYNLQQFLEQYMNLKTDANTLLVFRVNVVDEIVLMTKIPLLTTSLDEVKKRLRQIKSNSINAEMEEMHYEKRYQEEMRGNFDYQKPMSLAEQKKLKEDREIRRKQEEEFYAAMQPKAEETKPSNVSTYQSKTQTKPHVPVVKKDLKADVQKQRKRIRDSLKIYETDGEGMLAIKLRLPSSQSKKLYVNQSEPAQYLYDYIFSSEEDMGFEEDETKRVFDIIQPYEKLNLSQRKKQQLGKIFAGETMLSLVVNEKAD